MSEQVLILSNLMLLAALIASNAFWMLYSQKLINKLMSRNYHEYAASREQVRGPMAKPPMASRPESFQHPKEDISVIGPMISS